MMMMVITDGHDNDDDDNDVDDHPHHKRHLVALSLSGVTVGNDAAQLLDHLIMQEVMMMMMIQINMMMRRRRTKGFLTSNSPRKRASFFISTLYLAKVPSNQCL